MLSFWSDQVIPKIQAAYGSPTVIIVTGPILSTDGSLFIVARVNDDYAYEVDAARGKPFKVLKGSAEIPDLQFDPPVVFC